MRNVSKSDEMRVNNTESTEHREFPNHFIQFGTSTWTEDLPESEQENPLEELFTIKMVYSVHMVHWKFH